MIEAPRREGVDARAPRREAELSVVIVAANAYKAIARTIAHLRAQRVRERIELIIVSPSRAAMDAPESDFEGFAGVRWVDVGPIHNVDRSSGPGIAAATAPAVVALEDHVYPDPQWAERIIAAHAGSCGAVGPAMENANPSAFSWANMLINYGDWGADGGSARVMDSLPGHNIVYKRALLAPFANRMEEIIGRTSTLHADLQAAGHQLLFEPRARLYHVNPSKLSSSILIRFRGGRLYGATRSAQAEWPFWKRLVYVLGSPLIPVMQFPRVVRNARRCGRGRKLVAVLPALAVCFAATAVGEAFGYCFGAGRVADQLADMEFERFRQVTRRDLEALTSG